jgi:hypothetical protein
MPRRNARAKCQGEISGEMLPNFLSPASAAHGPDWERGSTVGEAGCQAPSVHDYANGRALAEAETKLAGRRD